MGISLRGRLLSCAALLSLAGAAPAWSQSAGTPAIDGRDAELVVTARKRAENVQKIPDSVAVLSARDIEEAGIRDVSAATSLIPNLSLVDSQDAGTVSISIRGIGQVRNGEAPVAIVVDGVQLNAADMIKQSLFDLERIEVLKGPQGALYGRNAIGGAINITTKAPSNDFHGGLTGEYANGNDRRIIGSVSGPIVPDRLLFRVAGDYRKVDGLFHNVTLDRKVDFRRDLNLRGRLMFTPTDQLTIDLRGSYGNLDGGASWYIALPDNSPNDTRTPIAGDFLGYSGRDFDEQSLKIDYAFGGATFTSITARSKTDLDFIEDLEWLPASILGAKQRRQLESFTQEFRLTSDSAQRLRWTVGGFYLDGAKKIDTVILISPDPNASRLPPEAYAQAPVSRTTEKMETIAAYGQLNYDLTDALELTLALRYDHDRRRLENRLETLADRKTSFDEWQPKLSLKYDIDADTMVYGTIARGFRSGGFNPPTDVFPAVYRPETADSIEIGSKNSFFGRALTLNLAGFYTRYKNQQVFVLNVADQGVVNIAKTDILGLEAEAVLRPAEGLELFASLGLIDSKIKNFNGTALYRGNKVPLTYGWSYNLGAQYRHALSDTASLTGRIDYSGKGNNYWHIDNVDKQDDVHLVNARLTLDMGRYTVAAFVENLFDVAYTEEFFAKTFSAGLTDIRYPGTPRRYGVTASLKF